METKKTILIADTSEEFRTILADALQAEEGLEVVGQTSDGQEAIQMVQDRSPVPRYPGHGSGSGADGRL